MIYILLILLGASVMLVLVAYILAAVLIWVAFSNFIDILYERVRKLRK